MSVHPVCQRVSECVCVFAFESASVGVREKKRGLVTV